ncbi:PB1 domain-containing protein [Mycotypha africana]|uniref:PB1 domain-containing protein n=1 Tax=Mycotypha africana TaxID=64632 RepID=UPI002300AED6|nr:PB1 domain-containing protein [Mycotypha africana]KAI8979427.1 PB1 domain-containing protein [Mycotypha africana]
MTDYTNLRKIVTGDIIVKCRYGADIRRIPINQTPTYDELCIMMNRVFKGKIKPSDDIVLKYTDDEGDLINLSDDADITHAISISNLLKVTVYDKSTIDQQDEAPLGIEDSLKEVQKTLNKILKHFNDSKETQQDVQQTLEKTPSSVNREETKKSRSLTAAELASFDTSVSKNAEKTTENSSVKDLATLSPEPSVNSTPSQAASKQKELLHGQPQIVSQAQMTQPLPQQLSQPFAHNVQQASQSQQFRQAQPLQQNYQQQQPASQQSSSTAQNQYLQSQQQPPSHPHFRPQAPLVHYTGSMPPPQQRLPYLNPPNNNRPPLPKVTHPSQQNATNSIAGNPQLPPQPYRSGATW